MCPVQPTTGMCVRELGTTPMRGKRGAQRKESNKHMLYLGDIKQSKSYQVAVSLRDQRSLGRKRKKNVGSSKFCKGSDSCSRAIGQLTIHGSFFFFDILSMVL